MFDCGVMALIDDPEPQIVDATTTVVCIAAPLPKKRRTENLEELLADREEVEKELRQDEEEEQKLHQQKEEQER